MRRRSTNRRAVSGSIGSTVGALGRSLRRRSHVRNVYASAVLKELGPHDASEWMAQACREDAEALEARGQTEGAALLREAAATFDVARRRMVRLTKRGWLLAFSGTPGIDLKRYDAASDGDVYEWLREHRPRAWATAVLSANMRPAEAP